MSNKSTGNLYVNDYKKPGEKKPDYTGSLEITREQIQELISAGKAGKEVKLKLGCWTYPSKRDANEIRLFIVAEAGDQPKKEGWDNSPKPDPKNSAWDDDVPF